tara:strand:+ start:592 stop:915 length:324 start_codon:yes stop_codon:yes gene_type:complete
MTKETIVTRLIDQGHIIIKTADSLLNKKDGYAQDIQDLHRDGQISTAESITLLKDADLYIPPYFTQPDIVTLPHISYPYNPGPSIQDPTGNPPNVYCQSTTLDKIQN